MPDPAVIAALEHLRSHARGDLRFGDHIRAVKYAIAPDGRLILPVMVAMLQEMDTVLFIPEMAEGAMELQLTLDPFKESGESGALADRWRIHHGDPPDVRWACGHIDAARLGEFVLDGEALTVPNALAAVEPQFCRWMNDEHREQLPAICRTWAGIGVAEPVVVGVDPGGLSLRGCFDVYRAAFEQPVADEAGARAAIAALIEESRIASEVPVPEESPPSSSGERHDEHAGMFDEPALEDDDVE